MDFLKIAQMMQGLKSPKLEQGMNQLQNKLSNIRVEGVSGGGSVRIVVNGHFECKKVIIDKAVIKSATNSPIILEDLVRTAINDAMKRSTEAIAKEQIEFSKDLMNNMFSGSGSSNFGGLSNLMKNFGMGNNDDKKELK